MRHCFFITLSFLFTWLLMMVGYWKLYCRVGKLDQGCSNFWCYGAHEEIDHNLRSPTINFISAVIASLDSCKISQVNILISKRIARRALGLRTEHFENLWTRWPHGLSPILCDKGNRKCSLFVENFALNNAIASALAYILRNAVWSIDCVNHYFVAKKQ